MWTWSGINGLEESWRNSEECAVLVERFGVESCLCNSYSVIFGRLDSILFRTCVVILFQRLDSPLNRQSLVSIAPGTQNEIKKYHYEPQNNPNKKHSSESLQLLWIHFYLVLSWPYSSSCSSVAPTLINFQLTIFFTCAFQWWSEKSCSHQPFVSARFMAIQSDYSWKTSVQYRDIQTTKKSLNHVTYQAIKMTRHSPDHCHHSLGHVVTALIIFFLTQNSLAKVESIFEDCIQLH